jgi:hypothetical protein
MRVHKRVSSYVSPTAAALLLPPMGAFAHKEYGATGVTPVVPSFACRAESEPRNLRVEERGQ